MVDVTEKFTHRTFGAVILGKLTGSDKCAQNFQFVALRSVFGVGFQVS